MIFILFHINKKVVVFWTLFIMVSFTSAQTFINKRLSFGTKPGLASSLAFENDTFFIPAMCMESTIIYSSSLMKVTKAGAIISQKRFKPLTKSYENGNDILKMNSKFYLISISRNGNYFQQGLYVFNNSCDTLFARNYTDTTYWNYGWKIKPYKREKGKLVLIGATDSTCGPGHLGYYKPIVRLVDTNGTVYQTKVYLTVNKYRSLTGADTTENKGYIMCGIEMTSNPLGKPCVIKLDSNLNQKWVKYLPNSTYSFYSGVTSLRKGGHLVTHNTIDSSGGGNYYERVGLTKLDTAGNIVWQKFYGIKQIDIGSWGIKEMSNGDFVISGVQRIKYTSSVSQMMGFLIRTDSLGTLKWRNNYIPEQPVRDTIADSYLFDLLEMPDKGIAVSGWAGPSSYFGTMQDPWLLRVDSMGCLVSGCTPFITDIKEQKNKYHLSVHPNPALNFLFISSDKYFEPSSKIEIINSLGQVVLKTEYKERIEVSEFSSGIYYAKIISTDHQTLYSKFIKE